MKNTNLVIQTFGRENEYKRAILTILSFYAHTSLPLEKTRVILFTDNPAYFSEYLKGLPVHYIFLSPEKIKDMRGKIDFLHRMKIALIEEAFGIIEGPMFYADSDTFFTSDPSPLVAQVSEQVSFMHLREFYFKEIKDLPLPAGQTSKDFVALLESRQFILSDGSLVRYSREHSSWNAGVMIFHPTHARFIPDVYLLTDQFFPDSQHHASEQFAFSLVLQENTKILPCDKVIYHYWYRVKKQIIDLYLQKHLNSAWASQPLEEKIMLVRDWTKMLPGYFLNHVLTLRDNAIQAFNEDNYLQGYKESLKALVKAPFDKGFILDMVYHTRRKLIRG